jgi:hypothetical protein
MSASRGRSGARADRGDGAFSGEVGERVGAGCPFCVDQEFFVELFARAQHGTDDLYLALRVLDIGQRQCAEAHRLLGRIEEA